MKHGLLLLVVLCLGCSTPAKLPPEITANPEKHDLQTVAILGINDFHGSLTPRVLKTREEPGVEPTVYERGGAATLATFVRILRSQFKDHFVLVDAGDAFQGTIDSNLTEGESIVQFFNLLKLNAAALGNHEFDFGPVGSESDVTQRDLKGKDVLGAIKERMKEAHYPYVAANIVEKETKKAAPFPNTFASLILKAGRLRIGAIGLITRDTPFTTRTEYVKELQFTDFKEATLREAKLLREAGAEIVIAVAHAGLKCELGRASPASTFRKPTDPLGACGPHDELVVFLNSLPEGTLDAVVSGHTHQIVHHFVNGVPVIQGGAYNQFFNVIYLTYDWTRKALLRERTRIEGPVPICPKVFENQGDCNGEKAAPNGGRGSLVTPLFHGVRVESDPETEDFLKPIVARSATAKERVVGFAERPIFHTRTEESPLGNLLADIVRERVQADAAIINSGGIRADWEQGPITYEALFRTVPFDNTISLLKLTGKELKLFLRIAENGIRGLFPVSGLRLKLRPLDEDTPATDLNRDGKKDPWETDRLLSALFTNGSPIVDSKIYRVATVDFLVAGGDDMGWFMRQIPPERITLNAGGMARDTVEQFLLKSGKLNSAARPLVNSRSPRFTFVRKLDASQRRKPRVR